MVCPRPLDTETSPIGVVTDYTYTNGYLTKKTVDSTGALAIECAAHYLLRHFDHKIG